MQALTALADPTRQRILEMLSSGALSSGDIASRFAMSAPAVSQHLKTLREAKLVRVRPEKQKRFYELDPEGVGQVADWVEDLRKFWANKLDALEAELNK
jgi:DNA-binding transcriptional ArsR family regulator